MSVLPPEVHSALAQLLQGLQSGDNNVRGQAEEQLNRDWIQQRPDLLLMGLAEQMKQHPDSQAWGVGGASNGQKMGATMDDGVSTASYSRTSQVTFS